MLLTAGKYAVVAALAFAVGTFFGREHPSRSAELRQFDQARHQLEQMFRGFAMPTPTPTP